MSTMSTRAAPLPLAPARYDTGQEQQFRMLLEQELQRLYALVANLQAQIDALP